MKCSIIKTLQVWIIIHRQQELLGFIICNSYRTTLGKKCLFFIIVIEQMPWTMLYGRMPFWGKRLTRASAERERKTVDDDDG